MRIMHAAVVGVLGRARVRLPICMCSGVTTHSCRCCSASIARLRGWLVGLRHQFEVTTFDFIDLMEIDWRGAFTCPNGAKHLTGDGIAIGFKASECFIQRPWEADPDGALVAGTAAAPRLRRAASTAAGAAEAGRPKSRRLAAGTAGGAEAPHRPHGGDGFRACCSNARRPPNTQLDMQSLGRKSRPTQHPL